MVYYLLLFCVPIASGVQSVAQKQYNLKVKHPNSFLFSAVTSLIALLFFVMTSGFDLTFDSRLVPYALCYSAGYSAGWVGTVMALQYGMVAISTLIISCSLIFPTFYGIMMGEEITYVLCIGIILLFLAIILVNLKLNTKEKASAKWLLWVLLAFGGNGVCSISQNMQKDMLGDGYKHEFMILALVGAFLALMSVAVSGSKDVKSELKSCAPFAVLNGTANAMNNLLFLTIIGNIPNTILYPTSSGLNMIATFLIGYIVYRERFSTIQYLGYVLGLISIVLLNM